MRNFICTLLTGLFFLPISVFSADVQNPRVVIETNLGSMTIELYPQAAPMTVDNFLSYVNSGFYDYLIFHRVIKNFMIQGGGYFYYNGFFYRAQTAGPIINESSNGLKNLRGTIAMARTSEPHSATSEFFINHVDNPYLDRENAEDGVGYCVFGQVIEGMDVVDTIAQIPIMKYSQPQPLIYFEALPQSAVYIIRAYVRPCDVSYGSNFNADNVIDFEDFAIFASNWLNNQCGSANRFCGEADLDFSTKVDIADLDLFLQHWSRKVGYEPELSDWNKNKTIGLDDLSVLAENWLRLSCSESNNFCNGADLDHNQKVDMADFGLFTANWQVNY